MDPRVIGVLGGGQLGRMLVEATNRRNIKVHILDAPSAPAKQISAHDSHIEGSFKDAAKIRELAKSCDVVTVEIEHVDTDVLEEIANEGVKVEPSWKVLQLIKDKFSQKAFLGRHGVPTAESVDLGVMGVDEVKEVGKRLGYPFMLKSKTEAYDGRGNYVVKSEGDVEEGIKALGARPLYAERWAEFEMELAVMVVKTKDGTLSYPTVETVHEDSICKLVYAPARRVSPATAKRAQEMAEKAVGAFEGKGVFGVEMFLLKNGELLVNEIAPRPHNSGHYTIEACPISQYDAHARTILDLPVPKEGLELRCPAIMLNILGGKTTDSHVDIAKKADEVGGATTHLYGKGEARKGRKMGHVTVTAPTMSEAENRIQPLIDAVDEQLGKHTDAKRSTERPVVAVVMGSDSDMPVLRACFQILERFAIPYQARITSAHRTPDWMRQFAKSAKDEGFKVIIAAAGGAAHLPGMAASWTTLPVIGVPVAASHLDGLDSQWSMTQMPRGEPVATVGIDNSTNAALLAARVLSVSDPRIATLLREYAENNVTEVMAKDAELLKLGPLQYLSKMGK
ncbi:phosphoribosylaminoimidazole carboxylase [Mytilinidion resinicola]|uniref:Phosphoribosylaminoimidazole carboxylase n=1 Tax=Mytilinidion resinicola TaxID=574789 RepID=A0A6A6Y328_9PEZI|nr:phosphoribosylaminoimidazole carboxylase [Mytilinidion resinicola]KAF2803192.1 phosphoribosylaminoimidazole carboxylase [Mytilinidion resinicola]